MEFCPLAPRETQISMHMRMLICVFLDACWNSNDTVWMMVIMEKISTINLLIWVFERLTLYIGLKVLANANRHNDESTFYEKLLLRSNLSHKSRFICPYGRIWKMITVSGTIKPFNDSIKYHVRNVKHEVSFNVEIDQYTRLGKPYEASS